MTQSRLYNVDALRGIAALAVVWFHLTGSSGLSAQTASFGSYGYLGVEVFFVISGFIIPLSMSRRNYKLLNFSRFIIKRVMRLDPPYFASIVLSIMIGYLGMGSAYKWPSIQHLAAHLGYANALLEFDWLDPVFWTLAIEFQFYLFIGIVFPLVAHRDSRVALGILTLFAILPVFSDNAALLPHWLGLFVLGSLAFRRMAFGTSWLALGSVGLIAALTILQVNGLPEVIAGILAIIVILFIKITAPSLWTMPFLWVGTISYSLYLTHWAFGRMGVALFRHVPVLGSWEPARVMAGVAVALLVAWILHFAIERPSIRWATLIKYKRDSNRLRNVPKEVSSVSVSEVETW